MSPPQASNLPAPVWEEYHKSKQRTEKAVDWLLEKGGELPAWSRQPLSSGGLSARSSQPTSGGKLPARSSQPLSVASLKRAASSIQWRNVQASEEVCYLFEDAISARRHMTSFYKSMESSPSKETETHQHFTSV